MALRLWLWFGVIGLLRRRTAAFLLLVGTLTATVYRGSQWRTAALGFFSKLWGWLQGFLWSVARGYHFLGEVLVDTDFLLDLEFYARMILISILGLCTENCFQFS